MPKVCVNLLGYNSSKFLVGAIGSVLGQTFTDYKLVFFDNSSSDGSVDLVKSKFPQVEALENGKNLGFSGGHNLGIARAAGEFVMVLNPDVVLDKDFLKNILPEFTDPRVGAVTGKLLRPETGERKFLDGTGITVSRSRRGRERGQLERDTGQYDNSPDVFGVSGTAAVYRRSALEAVKVPKAGGGFEYFDEDFFAYWEDMDLSWRLKLAGFKCRFAPKSVAYHIRTAGASAGGYRKILSFIKHHRALPQAVKRWNWKNHLFCIIKNDSGPVFWRDLPLIFIRELAMLAFILIFETKTLAVVPEFLGQLPKMLSKRKIIKSKIAVSPAEIGGWFE